MKARDATGEVYNRLTVLRLTGTTQSQGQVHWLCRCECGKEISVTLGHLRSGHTRSCGCYRRDQTKKALVTHGMSRTPEHVLWLAVKARCENPNHKNYGTYGGAGISVCPEWHDFSTFMRDMGPRPSPKHSIDRIDPFGDYEPSNCRWTVQFVQSANRKKVGKYGLGVSRVFTRRGIERFKAYLQVGGRKLSAGTFDTPEQAASAYLDKARELFGEQVVRELQK